MSAAPATARIPGPEDVRNLARQGVDSLAAVLKIVSDLTAQEVALVVGMLRERLNFPPFVSTAEAADRMVTGVTGVGKVLLDLVAGETAIVVDGMKEALRLHPSVAAMADLVPRGVGTVIDMHKRVLDSLAEQTRDMIEAYTERKPSIAIENLATRTRETFEDFIETQKTFLDQVTEQVTIATEAPKESKAARRDRSKVLIELARDSVTKFIDAQKQALDLAIEQAEANGGHAHAKAVAHTSMAELTRKSVENFTAAQKSLLDLALKPVTADSEAPKPAARRKPRPRKRAARAAAEAEA